MALSEGDRAIIRDIMFEVAREFNKTHLASCPYGKMLQQFCAKLRGVRVGIAIGLVLAGLGGGLGLARLLGL